MEKRSKQRQQKNDKQNCKNKRCVNDKGSLVQKAKKISIMRKDVKNARAAS